LSWGISGIGYPALDRIDVVVLADYLVVAPETAELVLGAGRSYARGAPVGGYIPGDEGELLTLNQRVRGPKPGRRVVAR